MDETDDSFGLTDESAAEFDAEFGRAASDYEEYRAEYPPELFDRLSTFDVGNETQQILDFGTGTGFIARKLAQRGCDVVGLDVDRGLLSAARDGSDRRDGSAEYVRAAAERTPFEESSFDVVTAGQCWHWFDRERATSEIQRVANPDGKLVVTHFDWLPRNGNVVAETEALIRQWNPDWPGANGDGMYPEWLRDVSEAGFRDAETFSFDVSVEYSHEGWRGRIRASAGVGGSLTESEVREFDRELEALLESSFPDEPLDVPHRSFTVVCTVPGSE